MRKKTHIAEANGKDQAARSDSREEIPWLQNGDHLTRPEFERRFDAMMPFLKKAELIDGVVYLVAMEPDPKNVSIHLPVRLDHGESSITICTWIGKYSMQTPGTDAGLSSSVRFPSPNSMPQPDVLLRIAERCGGQSIVDDDGYVAGAPELIVEVVPSSVSYDLHEKKKLYERDGVKEYIVWRFDDAEIDWFILQRGRFKDLNPDADGVTRSRTFPGLWLNRQAMLQEQDMEWSRLAEEGIASPEHAAFVAKLGRKRERKRK